MDLSKFKTVTVNNTALSIVILSLLVGCGGADNKQEPKPLANKPPIVSIDDISVPENTATNVSADASDPDGSITSYLWEQVSGPNVELKDTKSKSLALSTPIVTEDTELSFKVTVTDNKGAKTSATGRVLVKAKMVKVTLMGKVLDGPIANAKLKAIINDKVIEGQADKDGNYSLPISLDDSHLGDLIKITATGVESGSPVKLISYLGSLDSAIKSAGDDGTLKKNELFAVNITNVTTAIGALIQNNNEGKELTTVDAFNNASNEIDASLILPLSTAIKLVIDYSNQNPNFKLPEGTNDTLELVNNLDKASH
ncbi:hypothetical protein D5018_11785 [Parashewanella curva]|uniref:PKD/Chitinase domain-containing protein n=1 Tax=Parashewanella curva TaxID=2338552 RepID=A0A3L8PVR7_9GAMM|nr:hypothetical protein [Parashewanella curva]RLV59460.1 hypothetical protein D5018_11785 [Parashewanella curva]